MTVTGDGCSLTALSDETFSFNASVYTQEELETKGHNYELTPCGSTVLCIDHGVNGIGSNSCGPALLPQYQLKPDHFERTFRLIPSAK